jgi:hypothetical protein
LIRRSPTRGRESVRSKQQGQPTRSPTTFRTAPRASTAVREQTNVIR